MPDTNNTYLRFRDEEGNDKFFSIQDILEVGIPIDENGVDLEHVGELLYQWKDTERGFQYVSL